MNIERVDLISELHTKTNRNCLERASNPDKYKCAEKAKKFGFDYWDGDRQYGYGGYHYDGRWAVLAKKFIDKYKLTNKSKILDVGCGKGFLLYEIKNILPKCEIQGIDISEYGIKNSKEEVREYLTIGDCKELPWKTNSFDFAFSINVFHNLYIYDLASSIQEMARVCNGDKYICIESYTSENQRINLLNWQLTCEVFFTTKEWEWFLDQNGYCGEIDYIFFD